MDLQLFMQPVPITTKGRCFSHGTPVSFNNTTDYHDIAEILLKVALNAIVLIRRGNMYLVQYVIKCVSGLLKVFFLVLFRPPPLELTNTI